MGKSYRNINRQRDSQRIGGVYRKKFRWLDRCVYCGDRYKEMDHVLPLSVAASIDLNALKRRKNFHQGLNTVPSCSECNRIASDNVFFSILEKRKYIQSRLRLKYLKKIRTVIWEEDEIETLGKNLKHEVTLMMQKRERLEQRIYWPTLRKLEAVFLN